jgi:Protein of unknown function (DUF2752)
MVFRARQLGPSELDHELVWFGVSLTSFGMAALWFALHLPWPRCVFHDFTGLPCLTCGATRAAIQLFHGNFIAALKWNPLAFAGLCAVSIFDVYAAVVLVTHAPRLRVAHLTAAEKKFARMLVVALLALNWVYLLSHSNIYS